MSEPMQQVGEEQLSPGDIPDDYTIIFGDLKDITERLVSIMPLSAVRRYTDGSIENPGGVAAAARHLDMARNAIRAVMDDPAAIAPVYSLVQQHNPEAVELQEAKTPPPLPTLDEENTIHVLKTYLFFSTHPTNRVGMKVATLGSRIMSEDRKLFADSVKKAVSLGYLEMVGIKNEESGQVSDMIVRIPNDELLQDFMRNRKSFIDKLLTKANGGPVVTPAKRVKISTK